MALVENTDFVFSPRSTILINGLNTCVVIGTKHYLFLFPLKNLQGVGRTIKKTTTTIGGENALTQIQAKLASAQTVDEIEKWLKKRMIDELKLSPEHLIDISQLKEFKIKTGFLTKGLYYKSHHMKHRNGLGGINKSVLQKFQKFYDL